jgi:hypothetical protein
MIRIALVLAVVVAAAIAANVALLSVASGSHERVGELSPVLSISGSDSPPLAGRPNVSRPQGSAVPTRADENEVEDDADD